MSGPSVAYMKGEQGSLISLLAKRRPLALGWSYYVFALSSANKKIYQFRSELVCLQLLHDNVLIITLNFQ